MKIRRPPLAVSISQRSYMDLVLIHKACVMFSQYRFFVIDPDSKLVINPFSTSY